MAEHQKQTEFLKECLRYDSSAACQKMEREITQIQRSERSVNRAVRLMTILTALAAASLAYPAMMSDNFPYSAPLFIVCVIGTLGLGSLICLLAFVGLGMIYRRRLNQRREECRRMVAGLLESRLGQTRSARVPPADGAIQPPPARNQNNGLTG